MEREREWGPPGEHVSVCFCGSPRKRRGKRPFPASRTHPTAHVVCRRMHHVKDNAYARGQSHDGVTK